ncbi:MAG: NYN domain-containing protein [Myxococcales bacterium]|nr:NYN domain-containing protein [Myxococcales bacterium]
MAGGPMAALDAMIDETFGRARGRVLLVDGFNVLHAVLLGRDREDWWRRGARERLLERIAGWRDEADEIWVAFDGARPAWSVWAEPVARPLPRRRRGPIVHCVFVESADDWIVRRARRAAEPGRLVIVSADRQVAGRARSAGCEVWSPWAFMTRCPAETAPPSEDAGPSEAGAWISVGT